LNALALRTLSLGLAASVLAAVLWLYTRPLWAYGLAFIYPFVGAPLVGGVMVWRRLCVRMLRRGDDPTARAIELTALGVMLAPFIGSLIEFYCLPHADGDHCGLVDASTAATALGFSWPVWGAGELLVLVALVRHRMRFAHLRGYRVLATLLSLVAAPPLVVLACLSTAFESNHAGAGVVFLLPVAMATGSTVVVWTWGRSSAVGTALRRLGAAVVLVAVPLSLMLRLRGHIAQDCMSFSTTTTWGLLAELGWAAGPGLAAMMYFAGEPGPPAHAVRG
jgi:hypothetical protein